MRIILRTMDLPGKSAALYRPRKSPIETEIERGIKASFKSETSLCDLSLFFTNQNQTILHCNWMLVQIKTLNELHA